MLQLIYAVIVLVIVSSPTSLQVSLHIRNGTSAAAHSHPWLMTLDQLTLDSKEEKSMCGASLIRVARLADASDIAVTAAHCILEDGPCSDRKDLFQTLRVIAGNHNLKNSDDGQINRKVVGGICHPKWRGAQRSLFADIAVLKLSEPIHFTDTIKPIDLPIRGESIEAGATCVVAGWGRIGNSESLQEHCTGPGTRIYRKNENGETVGISPETLQESEVRILSDRECSDRVQGFRESMMCEIPKDDATGVYKGDSGSAVVCKKSDGKITLDGVVSLGAGGWDGKTNVYTEVGHFADWIRAQSEDQILEAFDIW